MSIFLGNFTQVAEGKYRVGLQNAMLKPLQEYTMSTGFVVEQLPIEEEIEGKYALLYCNPETKEVWYEYLTEEVSPDDEIATLKAENKILKENQDMMMAALNELILGGGV